MLIISTVLNPPLLPSSCIRMPQNRAFEDEEATSGLEDSRPANPTPAAATDGPVDESTALQEVSTYFSDEKILIPERDRVSFPQSLYW